MAKLAWIIAAIAAASVQTSVARSFLTAVALTEAVSSANQGALELTLLDLDKPAYRVGEPFVYHVRVRNTASESYALPIAADRASLRHVGDLQISTCTFRLEIRDAADTAGAVLPEKVLYGSPSISASHKILAPGGAVRIEVPGVWQFASRSAERDFSTRLPSLVEVRATIACAGRPGSSPRSVSARSITNAWVLLQPKEPIAFSRP